MNLPGSPYELHELSLHVHAASDDDLSSVGLGTREVCRSGNETTIRVARAHKNERGEEERVTLIGACSAGRIFERY